MSDRPFVPYARQDIEESDRRAVLAALDREYVAQGPGVEAFERDLADYLGVRAVVAVSSGTAGLHLACLAAQIAPGDAVVVPALTFAATANAVLYCGATPVFADIEESTLGLSPASVERAVALARSKGLRPKALIPLHYAGLPCNLAELVPMAERHGLMVIADACHALGASYRLRRSDQLQLVGAARGAAMSVLSFHAVKHVTTGEGGAITTDDDSLAKQLRLLRSHGIGKDPEDFVRGELARDPMTKAVNPWYQEMRLLGFNYRMSDLSAALGRSQLARIDAVVSRRRAVADRYRAGLSSLPLAKFPPGDTDLGTHSYHLFPLLIDFAALGTSRGRVMTELASFGIGSQVHYLPVPEHAYYQAHVGSWLADDLPATLDVYERELSIPMYAGLSDHDVDRVIQALQEVLRGS